MMTRDIMRVMIDLHTFTAIDLAEALEVPEGTAAARLSDWTKLGFVERVKSSRTFIYAVSAKTMKIVAKLPLIDPDERCLMLEYIPITDRYIYRDEIPVLDTSEDEIFNFDAVCQVCGQPITYGSSRVACVSCRTRHTPGR